MNNTEDITNIGPDVSSNAVSLYGQDDAMEDFPVLKAFQQYIDSEQAKARKRLMLLCAFFAVLMTVIISVFVLLLINVSSHNQALNDRLIDFAMKERNVQPAGSAVVVQPPQDNSAILQLTEKMNDLQKRLVESQQAAAAAQAKALEASKPKEESVEEREIKRLKALLSEEKEKVAAEKERLRQAELEAYRRKHYPELYEQPRKPSRPVALPRRRVVEIDEEGDDDELDALLDDTEPISYYGKTEDDDDEIKPIRQKKPLKKKTVSPSPEPTVQTEPKATAEPEKNYSIPVDIKGSSSNWNIPLD